jgi:hypothetical protein
MPCCELIPDGITVEEPATPARDVPTFIVATVDFAIPTPRSTRTAHSEARPLVLDPTLLPFYDGAVNPYRNVDVADVRTISVDERRGVTRPDEPRCAFEIAGDFAVPPPKPTLTTRDASGSRSQRLSFVRLRRPAERAAAGPTLGAQGSFAIPGGVRPADQATPQTNLTTT